MEHEKHRTCKNCGGPIEPGVVYKDKWDCPACNAAIWGRFRRAVFWGGVTALACFLYLSFVAPGALPEDFTPLSASALVWAIITVVILLPGGAWGNGGGGNGGG